MAIDTRGYKNLSRAQLEKALAAAREKNIQYDILVGDLKNAKKVRDDAASVLFERFFEVSAEFVHAAVKKQFNGDAVKDFYVNDLYLSSDGKRYVVHLKKGYLPKD